MKDSGGDGGGTGEDTNGGDRDDRGGDRMGIRRETESKINTFSI